MRPSDRIDRFLSVSTLAARVYLGYKAISLPQRPRAPPARLKDGTPVAVKVQYPGIWEIVHNDLQSMRFLLRILNALERNLDLTPIILELMHNIPQELDFINEGHNAEIIAGNFRRRGGAPPPPPAAQSRLGSPRLVNAMLTFNALEMVQAFRDLGFRVRNPDDPTPYLAIGRAFMDSSVPGRAYADPDLVAEANARVARAVRANPIVEIPREFLLIMRVTGLLSGLGKHLDSRADVMATPPQLTAGPQPRCALVLGPP